MLLTRNVTRSSLFRILSYDSVLNIIKKCMIQEFGVKYRKNIGYLELQPKKYSNINNDLKTLNYALITHFSSDSSAGFSTVQ